jgi:hypothetical protein
MTMPTDILLEKTALRILCQYDGRPVTVEAIGADIELALSKPLATSQIEAALAWLKDQGFASKTQNTWRQDVWIATDKGKAANAGMY